MSRLLRSRPGRQARAKHVGWVLVVDGHEVTLVDTGYPGDHDRVIASLAQIGRSPADVAAVVLTHAHPDHLGSAESFRSTVGKPVKVNALEVDKATGARIEQVSIPTLMTMVWRPGVFVWALDVTRLKAAKVERLGEVGAFGVGAWEFPVGLSQCTHQDIPPGTARCTFQTVGCCWPVTPR